MQTSSLYFWGKPPLLRVLVNPDRNGVALIIDQGIDCYRVFVDDIASGNYRVALLVYQIFPSGFKLTTTDKAKFFQKNPLNSHFRSFAILTNTCEHDERTNKT